MTESWDGWGAGMSGTVIAQAKDILSATYSYASGLDDSQDWTPELTTVLKEYQARVNHQIETGGRQPPKCRTDGRMGWATQVQLGIVDWSPPLPVMLTAQGTGQTMWQGYPADTARAVAAKGLLQFQPLGNWPAGPPPFWGSIQAGIAEGERQAGIWGRDNDRDLILGGYSQGAIVTGLLWKYSFNNGGPLEDIRDKVIAAVTWGNPCREQSHFRGDGCDWDARLDTAGVCQEVNRLTETPPWWVDYAHKNDLYADCEMDQEGEFKRAIGRLVIGRDIIGGLEHLVVEVCELFGRPIVDGWAMLEAMWDAGTFFVHGTHPHVDYCIGPAVDYLSGVLR